MTADKAEAAPMGRKVYLFPESTTIARSRHYAGRKVQEKVRYGYARVSTDDQNMGRQRIALDCEQCDELVEETQSGVKARHRLDGLIGRLKAGDELIVTEIDRLGRSTGDVILMMDDLTKRGIVPRVLAMPALDIRNDDGRLIADIMASFAAHERRRTRRRQEQGIAAAKAAGRHLGRLRKLNGQQVAEARARIEADEPARLVARAYGVDVKTLRATLALVTSAGSASAEVKRG